MGKQPVRLGFLNLKERIPSRNFKMQDRLNFKGQEGLLQKDFEGQEQQK